MKYFDVHAHIFPEKIAGKVVDTLEKYYGCRWQGTGMVDDLLRSMDASKIDRAVVFSCATKPEQVIVANDYLQKVQTLYPDRFVALGTIHPDFPDVVSELKRIKDMGLHGLKLHPDFQKIYIDEPLMMPIYENAGDLPLLFHIGDEKTDFSSPYRLRRVLDRFPELVIIAAHMGGYSEWDEAWKHLVGRNLYFDTSSTLWRLPLDEAVRLAHAHGADKLLFASDYPAAFHERAIADVLALGFNEADNRKIFYKNAEKIFKIKL